MIRTKSEKNKIKRQKRFFRKNPGLRPKPIITYKKKFNKLKKRNSFLKKKFRTKRKLIILQLIQRKK